MTLSKETVKAIRQSMDKNSLAELNNGELFLIAYKEYKGHDAKEVRKALTDLLDKSGYSTNIIKIIKGVFSIAEEYTKMNIVTNFKLLEYTNIKGVVTLLKYIKKHYDEEKLKEVHREFRDTYIKGESNSIYNNKTATRIKYYKALYKVKPSSDNFRKIKKEISTLTSAQKEELIALLRGE